jgi:hypothetical protein
MRGFDVLSFHRCNSGEAINRSASHLNPTDSLLKFSACGADICSSKNHRFLINESPNYHGFRIGLKLSQEKDLGALMFHTTSFHEDKGGNFQPKSKLEKRKRKAEHPERVRCK